MFAIISPFKSLGDNFGSLIFFNQSIESLGSFQITVFSWFFDQYSVVLYKTSAELLKVKKPCAKPSGIQS